MDEPHISDPRVRRCLNALVRKWLHKFQGFNDIDHESLFADVWGSLVTAKYDETKSAPHTFGVNVATRRMLDKLRSLPKKVHSYGGEKEAAERVAFNEDQEGELVDIAGQFYRGAVAYCPLSIQLQERRPGRPTLTMAQKATITMLLERMRWSYREAESYLAKHPSILAEIGVTEPKSRQFFYRAKITVTKFVKSEKRLQSAATAPRAA